MNNITKINDYLYYVGVSNHYLPKFENRFTLNEGVSFNSYVLLDEKTVLFDTVDESASVPFLENVDAVLKDRPLDYLVISHMEPDHASNIERIIKKHPNVKLIGNKNTFALFEQFFSPDYQDHYLLVKEGFELSVGKNTLRFVMAPLVHWPEVLVTYIPEQKALFSADAFGAFGSIKGHLFSDEGHINLSEFRRYFANILAKFRRNVQSLLKKLDTLEIELLLSLHGMLHRDKEIIKMLFEKYHIWSKFEVEDPGVIIAYTSMYGNTANAANRLADHLGKQGVKNIRIYDLDSVDVSYVVGDVYRFSNLVIMAPNYNITLHPTTHAFVNELSYLGLTNRNYSLIVNESWGGRAMIVLNEEFGKLKGNTLVGTPFTITTKLDEETTPLLDQLAVDIKNSL